VGLTNSERRSVAELSRRGIGYSLIRMNMSDAAAVNCVTKRFAPKSALMCHEMCSREWAGRAVMRV
jgi:hypothetical protein